MSEHVPGDGDVKITLRGEEYTLRCTLAAALAISRLSGGIRGAITRVNDLDLDTITGVVRAGVGPETARQLRNLEEVIWRDGILAKRGELVVGCVDFLLNLAHGGKVPASGEEGDPEDPTIR